MSPLLLRILRLVTLALVIPLVLFLTRCASNADHEADLARRWCEGTIAIYESDRAAFLTRHAKRIHHGILVVRPSSGPAPASADFTVRRSGDYVCRYWHGGSFPAKGRRYSNDRPRWVDIE